MFFLLTRSPFRGGPPGTSPKGTKAPSLSVATPNGSGDRKDKCSTWKFRL